MPRLQEEIELHADVVVPDRREPGDLDSVRTDLVGDVVPLLQKGDETGKIGYVVYSNSHPRPSLPVSAKCLAAATLQARDFPQLIEGREVRNSIQGALGGELQSLHEVGLSRN